MNIILEYLRNKEIEIEVRINVFFNHPKCAGFCDSDTVMMSKEFLEELQACLKDSELAFRHKRLQQLKDDLEMVVRNREAKLKLLK